MTLAVIPREELQGIVEQPMTTAQVLAQKRVINQVLNDCMKEGEHYGKVPGCGDKKTLLKPGAETIMATFRIAPEPQIEDLSSIDSRRYRITIRGISSAGQFLGAGVGECSSDEEKYHWRGAVCDAEYAGTPEDCRRIKYFRNGNVTRQVRINPADAANTVLKMAYKRALVSMVLTVTAASDCFAQDLEDIVDTGLIDDKHDHVPQATPKPQAHQEPVKPKPSPVIEQSHEPFPVGSGDAPRCQTCNSVMKFWPAGNSKQSGKPYSAFWSCPSRDHKFTMRDTEWQEYQNKNHSEPEQESEQVYSEQIPF